MKKASYKVLTLLLSLLVMASCFMALGSRGEANVYAAIAKNAQYSLAGAQYQLYTNSSCTTPAKDANGNNAVMTTDADGNVSAMEIEVGTYYAKEITASPGYVLDASVHTINITENATASFTSIEMPTVGRMINLQKYDQNGNKGWRALLNAEYTLSYYDVDPSTEDVSGMTPVRSWKFKTVEKKDHNNHSYAGIDFMNDEPLAGSDDFYVAKVLAYQSNGQTLELDDRYFDTKYAYFKLDNDGEEARVMPIGVFTIEETKAPAGLSRNTTVYYGSVTQPSMGADAVTAIRGTEDFTVNVHTGQVDNAEEEQGVEIAIEKVVGQTGEATPMGKATSFEGAVYNVYYDDPQLGQAELIGKITTDANGKGKLTKREMGNQAFLDQKLSPGTYYIEEVTAPAGFIIDKYKLNSDGTTGEVSGSFDAVVAYEEDGTPVTKTVTDTYADGQHKVLARVQITGANTFTYTLKSTEYETETHIKKTDAATSKELPGATLQIYSLADNSLVEEWTSTNEEHIVYGLATGDYLLREITAPNGYDVAEDIEFTVKNDEVVTKVEMKNKPIKVGTIANDADTRSHQGTFKENEKICDKVSLKGLTKGRTYQVKGVLYDKEKGEALKDSAGHEITAECEPFVATAENMDVVIEFTVDSSQFTTSKQIVVFEKLYRTEKVQPGEGKPDRPDEEVPVELDKHEDPNDAAQTITYGGIIETVAADGKSKTHNILAGKDAVIVDTVKYENLSTEETYTIKGVLYDKTTGQLTDIAAMAKFKPTTSSGSIQLEFKFDASGLQGHTLVAYETLYINDTQINKHEDPNDENQTMYVPGISTKIGKKDGDYVIDTVKYNNLIPGKTYVMKGYFVKQKNGSRVKGSDGSITITPTAADGAIEVRLKNVEGSGNVVAFEECYITDGSGNEYLVGEHKNIDDADQLYNKNGKIVVNDKDKFKKVQTGDETQLFLWVAFFVTTLALFTVLAARTIIRRRH